MRRKTHGSPKRMGMISAAVVVLMSPMAIATWGVGLSMPVARLIENMTKYTEAHPGDAGGYYALGRVHSYAFSTGQDEISARGKGDVPTSALGDESDTSAGPGMRPWDAGAPDLTHTQRLEHLQAAIENIQRALEKGLPTGGAYFGASAAHLSLGFVLEHGAEFANEINFVPEVKGGAKIAPGRAEALREALLKLSTPYDPTKDAEAIKPTTPEIRERYIKMFKDSDERQRERMRGVVRDYWLTLAAEHYLIAFRGNLDTDIKTGQPMSGNSGGYREMVSYEAGQSYMRVINQRGAGPEDRDAIAEVNKGLRKLEEHDWGGGYITPVIFSLNADRPLADLINPSARVPFDLDATGRDVRWSWVRPDTAILVWDPDHTGTITSGRQLFGNATWWVLFEHGYQALDALDDDRDGLLTGAELVGVRAWFDRNTNGVSDEGEVVDLDAIDVVALGCRVTGYQGASPVCREGVELSDGSVLPSYDWIAHAAPVSREADDAGVSNP